MFSRAGGYGGEPEDDGGGMPELGTYCCTARAGATQDAAISSEIVHVHEAGDELDIAETRQMSDGRWRGRGPEGWVSFVSERGNQLLELIAHVSSGRLAALELPTPDEWRAFYDAVGISDRSPIDTSTVARAVSELLPGFSQPRALAAAYKALELSDGSAIQRHELEMLFRHLLFFDERWDTIEDLRHEHGESLGLEQCQDCCHALLGDARTEQQLADSFVHLSRGQAEISFDSLLTWLSRRTVGSLAPSPAKSDRMEARSATRRARSPLGLRPAARVTPSWAMEMTPQSMISPEAVPPTPVATPPRGPVRATVRMRAIVDRVRVHGEPGTFASGFQPGTRLFSDSTCVASQVPEYLHSARVLLGLPMLEDREYKDEDGNILLARRTRTDYVTFGPSTDAPIQVYILYPQRDFVPAWLQRGFEKTCSTDPKDDVVQAAQRVNKRADAVTFTLDIWRSKRTYSRSISSGSPTQLHPDPSRLPRADLVKLGAADLDNVALLDDRERVWDRDVQQSDEQAAHKAGKLHNYVVLVVPVQPKEVRATSEHLSAVPVHRQGTKSPSARSRSPNPNGFGSNTGYRAKSPAERVVSEKSLVATPPRAAAVGSTASMRANRSGSPKPRSKSPKPVFGSSSPMPHAVDKDSGAHQEALYGTRGASPGRARPKSAGKVRPPPRVAGLSPARIRPLDPPQVVANAPAFGSGSSRILGATSPGRSSHLPVARQPAGSRAKSPKPGGRSKSPRPNSPGSRAKSPIPFAKTEQNDEIIGAHVLARLPDDGKWHGATVTQVLRRGKQVVVNFDDYPIDSVVPREDVVVQAASTQAKPKQVLAKKQARQVKQAAYEDDDALDPIAGTQHIEITPGTQKLVTAAFRAGSTVDLNDRQLGDEQFKAVADTLANYTDVEKLELRRNAVGSKGGALLGELFRQGKHRQLTSIDLASNSLGDVGASKLLKGIAEASCVETLELAENNLGAKAAVSIRDMIVANSALRTLGLRGNNLGGSGLWQLADSLIQDTSLTSLDLESNGLSDVGGRALGLCLRHNHGLQRLVITDNEIRDNGGEAIAAGLAHNSSLHELEAGHNRFGEGTADAMATTMAGVNRTLQILNLEHTGIDRTAPDAIEKIDKALRLNKSLSSSSPRSRAGASTADASLRGWCAQLVERILPASDDGGTARYRGSSGGDSQSVATEILLDKVHDLLRQRGLPPNISLRTASAAPVSDEPVHRNATSPRPVGSPSASVRRGSTSPSPHSRAVVEVGGGAASMRGSRASITSKSAPQHSDPQAVLAFVDELFKGGLINQSVYETRRAAILETIPLELTGVWEVDGRTSDDRPVKERIELVQLPTGELRGGPAPMRPGDATTEPENFTVHEGRISDDQLTFLQRYTDDEETRWTATISRSSSPTADGSSRPFLVDGTW
jgi:Ran GTPase-activating protein (RanGAP) involved in mRNA processing and transport